MPSRSFPRGAQPPFALSRGEVGIPSDLSVVIAQENGAGRVDIPDLMHEAAGRFAMATLEIALLGTISLR